MRDDLIRYAFGRLLFLPFYLLLVSFIVFSIGRYGPGDPVLLRAGPKASEETVEQIRKDLGLDRALYVQYADYMKGLATGDLGESISLHPGKNVKDLIWPRIKISAPITLSALLIAFSLGTLIGLVASFKRNTWIDSGLIGTFLFFSSIPSLIMVQFMIMFLALKMNWVPAGWTGDSKSVFTTNMIIPVSTLSLISIAGVARFVRATTLSVIGENFVRTAKAKGLPPWVVASRHVLRNALLPLITVIVTAVFTAIEGSLFVERVYGIPGMGVFMVESVFAREYDVITSMTVIISMLSVISYIVADILYKFVDPRVDLTKRA